MAREGAGISFDERYISIDDSFQFMKNWLYYKVAAFVDT